MFSDFNHGGRRERVKQIEGLRAVCVVLVLLFHVDADWLPAGYLGVDAFFAISGYVISRLIYSELSAGRFSLAKFYRARAARLMPSLMVVIVATVVCFYFLYGRNDFLGVAYSALAATFSVSNIYFYMHSGYFGDEAIYQPLLHTWSLGVEEQFYLVWPIVFVLLVRFRSHRVLLFGLLTLATFAVTLFYSRTDPELVFFLSPFRVYQFFLGAALALLSARDTADGRLVLRVKPLVDVMVVPIMIALSLPAYSFGIAQNLAQVAMCVVAAGTCYIMDIGERLAPTRRQIPFGLGPVAFLGSRSYAIYLVHWPIITAAQAVSGDESALPPAAKLALLAASIIGGVALSALVERRLRFTAADTERTRRHKLASTLGLVASTTMCAGVGLGLVGSLPFLQPRSQSEVPSRKELWAQLNAYMREKGCVVALTKTKSVADRVGRCLAPDKANILVVGDSLTGAISAAFAERFPATRFVRVFRAGCAPYFGTSRDRIAAMANSRQYCERLREQPWIEILRRITQTYRVDGIVVTGSWTGFVYFDGAIAELMQALNDLGVPVGFVGMHPLFRDDAVRLYEHGLIDSAGKNSMKPYFMPSIPPEHVKHDDDVLKAAAKAYDFISFIDVYDAMCAETCPAFDHGALIYIDQGHLTLAGAKYLARTGALDEFMKFVDSKTSLDAR